MGESVIAVTQTQWSNFDYNDESLLTDDELKAEEILMIKEEKKSKSRRKANDRKNGKPKKHTLDDFTPFGKEVPKINTPIEKGWTIIECSDCYHQQWRKANAHTFTTPCGICDCDNGFLQVDQEFLNGNKTKYCLVTNDMYHQIEMYDENVSYVGEAMRREMNIRRDKNGYETIKIGNRYIPVHLLKTIGDEIVSMKSPAYKQSRSAIQGIEFTGQRKINMEK